MKERKFAKLMSVLLSVFLLVMSFTTTTFAEEVSQVTFDVEFTNIGNGEESKVITFTESIDENGNVTVSYPSSSMADVNKDDHVFLGWKHNQVTDDEITISNPKDGKVYTARAMYEIEKKATIEFTLNFLELGTEKKLANSATYTIDDDETKKVTVPEISGYIITKYTDNESADGVIDVSNVKDYKLTLKDGKATEINVYYKAVDGSDDEYKRSSFTVKYFFEDETGSYVENSSLRVHGEGENNKTIKLDGYYLETIPTGFELSTKKNKNQDVVLVEGTNNIVKIHYDRISEELVPLVITHNYLVDGVVKRDNVVTVYLAVNSFVDAKDYMLTSTVLTNNYSWPVGHYTGQLDKESIDSLSAENNTITINYTKEKNGTYPYTVQYLYKENGNWVEIANSSKTVYTNSSLIVTEYAKYFNGFVLDSKKNYVMQNVSGDNNVITFKYTMVDAMQLSVDVHFPDGSVNNVKTIKTPSGVAVNAEDFVDLTSADYSGYEFDANHPTSFTPNADADVFNIYLKDKVVIDDENNNDDSDDDNSDDNSDDDSDDDYIPVVVNAPAASQPLVVDPVVPPVVEDTESSEDSSSDVTDESSQSSEATTQQVIEIDDEEETPLVGGNWSLLNFIIAAMSVVLAIYMFYTKEEKQANKGNNKKIINSLFAIISVALALFTQNILLNMVLVDQYTIMFLSVLIVQIGYNVFSSSMKNKDTMTV